MFFSIALKDYVDHIDNLSFIIKDNFTIFVFLKSFFLYFSQSILSAFYYITSFKWLIDFIELPINFKHNYITILEGQNLFDIYLEPKLDKNFFLFFEDFSLNSKTFWTGFFNSFFLVLPFSIPQLLAVRAFLINGLIAGIAAASGTILGQFCFFCCILFGFEWLLLPFLNFEVITLLLGFILLVNFLYKMAHNPNLLLIDFSQKKILFEFFKFNFILAWLEQTCVCNIFDELFKVKFPK